MEQKFKLCAVGGTFDRLHKGHAALLSTALLAADNAVIGITSDAMVRREGKKLASVVQTFSQRKKEVQKFLREKKMQKKARLIKLEEFAGPAKNSPSIDCIAVTSETRIQASKINALRKKAGLFPLKVLICPFVRAQDGRHISSTRIRLGHANRQGKIYARQINADIFLTKPLIHALKKPFSTLITDGVAPGQSAAKKAAQMLKKQKPTKTIIVGDAALQNLCKQGAAIDLGFADLKTRRSKIFNSPKELGFNYLKIIFARNPKSTVSKSLAKATKRAMALNEKVLVQVRGEEDLAVLPAILFAPLGSVVIYGQPNQGLVFVKVGEEEKEKAANILSKFAKTK